MFDYEPSKIHTVFVYAYDHLVVIGKLIKWLTLLMSKANPKSSLLIMENNNDMNLEFKAHLSSITRSITKEGWFT